MAFTLIEMLVVVAIIALLSALIVASASALGIGSKRERTATILTAVRNALDLHAAQHGSRPTPAEHPAAGSREPRAAFRRADDGSAVAVGGLALFGVPPVQVRAAERSRVLADDDRCADPVLPLLFGLKRAEIGVIGARTAEVTRLHRLPSTLTPADDPLRVGVLDAPDATVERHAAAIDHIIDRSGLRGELLALKALRTPEDTFTHPVLGGRLLSDVAPGAGHERWAPGRIAHGSHPTGGPAWADYRLPGATLVDAWGREILYSIDERGKVTLMSAGADGVFAIDPGPNEVLDSIDPFAPPAGDDRDGRRDNVISGQG